MHGNGLTDQLNRPKNTHPALDMVREKEDPEREEQKNNEKVEQPRAGTTHADK